MVVAAFRGISWCLVVVAVSCGGFRALCDGVRGVCVVVVFVVSVW